MAASDRRCPSALQLLHILLFAVVIVMNALSSQTKLVPELFPKSNAGISAERKTAFTPAGYAFSIWGVIYLFAALFIIFQAIPRNASWTASRVGPWMVLNLVANAAWLPLFQNEVGGMWASVGVIAGGIVLPLAVLHWRFWRPAALDATRWGEFVCVHPFISLYLGWTSVATIANTSIALTPALGAAPSLAGWSPDNWAITMMCAAAALAGAVVLSTRGRDWIFPIPIAWALAAIGVQQRDPAYPGGTTVVSAAFALSGVVGLLVVAVALKELVRVLRARGGGGGKRPRQQQQQEGEEAGALPTKGLVVVGNPAHFVGGAGAAQGGEWR